MKRRLLNLLTAVSVLLSVAVVVLWAWSYGTWRVGVGKGRVVAVIVEGSDGEAYLQRRMTHEWTAAMTWEELETHATSSLAFAGFELRRGVWSAAVPFTLLAVPLWPLLVATLALPAARLGLARRARRRAAKGLCARCGYDLRGTAGRCPECGAGASVTGSG